MQKLELDLTKQEPIPQAGIDAALAVMASGKLHRYGEVGGKPSEVSALEDPTRPGKPILSAKAKSLLEDMNLAPAVTLHRRRIMAEVESDSLLVEFKPPRRNAEWETPVHITIHFVRWSEGGRHQAYVPALGAHVFAARASCAEASVAMLGVPYALWSLALFVVLGAIAAWVAIGAARR
jgi:hypothetical protein